MANEIVERMMIAMKAADDAEPFLACACIGKQNENDIACPCAMKFLERHARVALAAIRNPTYEMIVAPDEETCANCMCCVSVDGERAWQAMVDAALKD